MILLENEVKLGHFQPRPNVPLRCAPMGGSEVSIYFDLIKEPSCNKRRRGN